MKRFAVFLAFFVAATCSAQTSKKTNKAFEPVSAFQKIVAESSSPDNWTRVIQNSKTEKWIRQFFYVGDIKYDVKKTDSMVNPVVGLASFRVSIKHAGPFETQAEAEAANSPSSPVVMLYSVDGNYTVKNNVWKLQEFKYKDIDEASVLKGSQYSADEAKINREPNVGIYHVMSKWLR